MRAATLGASLSLAVAALVGAPQVGLLAEDGGNGTGHPSWLQLAPASTGLADGDEQPLPLPEHFAFFEESKLAAAAFDPFSRDAPSVGGRFVRAEAAAPPAIVYAAAAPSGPIEPGITGCLSHDLFNDMQNAMNPLATRTHVALTVGQSKTAKYQATQLSFMIILLLLSIVVLLAPLLSMNSVVGIICYMFLFYFFFACLDALTWNADGLQTFTMCVLPMSLAIVLAIVFGVTFIFLSKRVAWVSVFVLGCSGGCFFMFLVRNIVVSTVPDIVNDRSFGWYWLGTLAVSLACGLLALRQRPLVYAVTTVLVGAYVNAAALSGIVLICAGQTMGFHFFSILFLTAGLAGTITHVVVRPEPPPSVRGSVKLAGLPAMKSDPAYGSVFV